MYKGYFLASLKTGLVIKMMNFFVTPVDFRFEDLNGHSRHVRCLQKLEGAARYRVEYRTVIMRIQKSREQAG